MSTDTVTQRHHATALLAVTTIRGLVFVRAERGGSWRGKFKGMREVIVADSETELMESAETVAKWLNNTRSEA
jgi:hypothetical protein